MSLSPAHVQDLHARAREAAERGDYAQAFVLAGTLMGDRPNDPASHVLMGDLTLAVGMADRAIEHREKVVAMTPEAPLRHVQLAEAYVHAGRLGDALAHHARALALDARFAPAIAGRAEVYEMQGHFKRAWKTLEPAIARQPANPSLTAVGVRVLMELGRLPEAIALGEQLLAANRPVEPQQRSSCLSLARAYERHKQYPEALAAAHRGNAMLAVPFDPKQHAADVDRIIDAYSAHWLPTAPRSTRDGSWAVFIVGMPRSGSTLTERILHAHPDAFGADEDFSFQAIANGLQREFGLAEPWPLCARELTTEQLDRCAQQYEQTMRAKAPRVRIISNKDLANMRRLGLADQVLPGARFIHTRRDPADNCLSCYFERLRPSAIPYASNLEHLAAAYAQNERLAQHWQKVCDNPFLTIRYEDIVSDLPGVARTLIDFVGLPWDDRCLRPHEANRPDRTLSVTQVRRPIYTSAKGRAAKYGDQIAPLHAALKAHGLES